METRYACAPDHVAQMNTKELRDRFCVEGLFVEGQVNYVYSHHDRVIIGAAVPTDAPLEAPTPEELHTPGLFDRREAGIINIGEPARVIVDGEPYELDRCGCLYVGRGTSSVVFEAPGRFYIFSAPAHTSFPTTAVAPDGGNVLELGDQTTSNRRTLRQFIYEGGIQSCQVVMGVTTLHEGSMWNTMPAHTHDRRMEAYMYFDIDADARVFHLMGEPSETRHVVLANETGVISPNWSIHSGVGTKAYSFIWAMAGENQAFADMDVVNVTDIS